MASNISLNSFYKVIFGGTLANPLAQGNQTLYFTQNQIVPLNKGVYQVMYSENDWIDIGGDTSDPEYKILKKYFIGMKYNSGVGSAKPKSCIMARRMQSSGLPATISSGKTADDLIQIITALPDITAMPITFVINSTNYTITLNLTGVLTQSDIAVKIQTALQAITGIEYCQDGKVKVKKDNALLFPNATCTFNANSQMFTMITSNAPNNMLITYCIDNGANSLSQLLCFTQLTDANPVNGVLNVPMSFKDNIQYIINSGMMEWSQFQTCYWQDTPELRAEIKSACEFTDMYGKKFAYLLTIRYSNFIAIRDYLVANKILELYGDVYFKPTDDYNLQLSTLMDGNDLNGNPRTQADEYSNSVIGGSIVVASMNPYAEINAYCRNPFGSQYDTVPPALISENEEYEILRTGAIAYATLAGNMGVFQQIIGSGRNTKDLMWLDLWANALFIGYRTQYELANLGWKGNLDIANAQVIVNKVNQKLLKAGLIQTPQVPLDWENNYIDNEYMEIASAREFGNTGVTTKNQVQNSINANGISFNVIGYQYAVDHELAFSRYIMFLHTMGHSANSEYIQKIIKDMAKQGKRIEIIQDLPSNIELHLQGNKNTKLESKRPKAVFIKFKTGNSISVDANDSFVTAYTPDTIREKGILLIEDFTPRQSFNGATIDINQINIG